MVEINISDSAFGDLKINSSRFKEDFDSLAQIGATGDGGVHRPAFSEAHLEARKWFQHRVVDAGLEFRVDHAGNHSGFLACGPERAPTLLLGSHLDSVPNGGRFDGALGVLAALECLRIVKEAGVSLPVNLEVIDFTDEEGTHIGLLGSSALAGSLKPKDLEKPRGGREALLAGLSRAGMDEEKIFRARRPPEDLKGYLELHIEQGRKLINANADVGIVTSIVGIRSYRLVYLGRADHAGTTAMNDRLDAAQGAGAFTLAVRKILIKEFEGCVANVGIIQLAPGAFNIVPQRASLALELRAPTSTILDHLERKILENAQNQAKKFSLGLEIERLDDHAPASMHSLVRHAILAASKALGLRNVDISSGAGHDAQSLASSCQVGMIFIPSIDGISHNPKEFSKWENCINGANVLLRSALQLAISDE